MIGIDADRRLFYEGSGNYGHGIWPAPFVSVATIFTQDWSVSDLPTSPDLGRAKLIFREDVFDPVTRIRRGRFYTNPGTQPQDWHVQRHPAYSDEVGQQDTQGNYIRRLFSFQRSLALDQIRPDSHAGLVALGFSKAFTLWRVVDVERIVTDENLVTMRARLPMGILPELLLEAIPAIGRDPIVKVVEGAIEAAYRAGPDSVIDRCRDAAQACIGLWFSEHRQNGDLRTLDLSPLLNEVERLTGSEQPSVLIHAGRIIARLHARKPNEQIKRGARSNTEMDAEVALANLGLIIRELGWARS